jgi:cell division protein FtsN
VKSTCRCFFPVFEVNTTMTHRLSRQGGGTLLGIIFGVLLGLAAAVAVAIYVTKVPVPFVDRAISRTSAQDAAEAERNKNWNPNAGLLGKSAKPPQDTPSEATPPAASSTASPSTAKADAPAAPVPAPTEDTAKKADKAPPPAKSEPTPDPPKTTATKPALPTDPLGDLVKASSQSKTTAPAEPLQYFVQVGAFNGPEDAQAQRAKLALMGLDARVSEREQAGRTVFRVRLGPFERLDDAEKMKAELHSGGMEAALVRVQR